MIYIDELTHFNDAKIAHLYKLMQNLNVIKGICK